MKKSLIYIVFLSIFSLTSLSVSAQEEKEEKELGAPIYHPLEPAFVVNLKDGGRRMRFMQIQVQVMTRESNIVGALESHDPAVRDAMILLLSEQDGDTMGSVMGREQVRKDAQSAIQSVLQQIAGLDQGVEAVYFTDFVIQ